MNVMTHDEAKELKTLERVIERGMSTFVEVGNALKTIRDSKLYREQYKTFDRYVQERWQFKKTYAYDLIASAEATENVRHGGQKLPTTERQARELAKAPPEKQAAIWEEVVESTPTPTAKDVKAAVEKHKQVEVDEPEDVVEAKSVVSIVRDSLDRDVPNGLREKFATAAILSAIGRKLDAIKREVVELADEDGGWFIPVQEIELACKDLKDKITDAGYWTACPRCDGAGCERCDSSGFIPKSKKNMLSKQDKELIGL